MGVVCLRIQVAKTRIQESLFQSHRPAEISKIKQERRQISADSYVLTVTLQSRILYHLQSDTAPGLEAPRVIPYFRRSDSLSYDACSLYL